MILSGPQPGRAFGTAGAVLLGAHLWVIPAAGQVDFSRYVALGDSLSAGVVNGSLVVTSQRLSLPALLARQAGTADFQQPLISEPGLPPQLQLISLLPRAVIRRRVGLGLPINLALPRPYNNLAVPGVTVDEMINQGSDESGPEGGSASGAFILRGRGSQVEQAALLRPTFVTVWIGNNDLLPAVVDGKVIDGVTINTPALFEAQYSQAILRVRAAVPGAPIVVFNLPDVIAIPYATSIPPYLVDPVTHEPILDSRGERIFLVGPSGSLTEDSLVTMAASEPLSQGIGIPRSAGGTGEPLSDGMILDPAEVSVIRARVASFNSTIARVAQAAGIPVLDFNRFLQQARAGRLTVGGVTVTPTFLTGGLVSLDAIHPSSLGYALITNELIRLINRTFSASIPEVNLGDYLGAGSAGGQMGSALTFVFEADAVANLKALFPARLALSLSAGR